MILRSPPAWKQAVTVNQICAGKACKRWKGTAASTPAPRRAQVSPPDGNGKPVDLGSLYATVSQIEKEKRSQERDFLASVLASSPTKRDAKVYLQTFGQAASGQSANAAATRHPVEGIRAVNEAPRFIQGPREEETAAPLHRRPHVAIIKFRDPQSVDDATLDGVAKTLAQLRALGLTGVVIVDCGLDESPSPHSRLDELTHQASRIAGAVDSYGGPVSIVVDSALVGGRGTEQGSSPFVPGRIFVDLDQALMRPLQAGNLVVIPSYALCSETWKAEPVSSNDVVLALARYFSGLQFKRADRVDSPSTGDDLEQSKKASVDRVIVLDPLGGIPAKNRPNGAHVFLNMEQEYAQAAADLDEMPEDLRKRHRENLDLARSALAILPPTSSALLTTPAEAANLHAPYREDTGDNSVFGYVGSVGTRQRQNPLIHNLLTDRPVYSSSLPLGRIKPKSARLDNTSLGLPRTTLVKRGMPVTIYPDPRIQAWVPPAPGAPRLRLTDTCVDLPRLVHLIEDSFNRKLDVQHYLDRVNDNLAGIIIAGEYEGGAILTWEAPFGLDADEAYRTGRLVPYLDKFAVLKKSQGAGGVADIVFNSMVRDCFPDGVCWRSRKDNPVNKWYFERSRGTWKLGDTNWTMFWTTPWEAVGEKRIRDYEDVCRNVVPSWADKKNVVD